MSSTAFHVCGRFLLLLATTIQLARSAPASSRGSSKEYLGNPDSYQDYPTFREPGPSDDKRAPWAPSLPRLDSFTQRIRELISEQRNKGKRGRQTPIELGQLSDDEVATLLKLLQAGIQGLDYEAMDFALKALNEREKSAMQQTDASKLVGKESRGSKGGPGTLPVVYQLDEESDNEGLLRQLERKRSSSPFNLGLGQHAASAAMSAYENILDEGRNYKQERPSSPVRFLGKR